LDSPSVEINSIQCAIAALAANYDEFGPYRLETEVQAAEAVIHRLFAAGVPAKLTRDALATHARLLVMSAEAALNTAHFSRANRRARHAAAVAVEAGDGPTAAHAWAVVAVALRITKQHHHALLAAHRGRSYAGRSPAAVMALLDEALIGAEFARGGTFAVYDAVTAAEEIHAKLAVDAWGTPGYSLGTYHPANLKTYGGAALAKVGMYNEAAPRLDEALDLLAGTDGLEKAYVRLAQARVALGRGEVDAAWDLAAMAITQAQPRPAAWVDRIIRELHQQSGGRLAELVEQTSTWGFATT
jgi:hypothetical protein